MVHAVPECLIIIAVYIDAGLSADRLFMVDVIYRFAGGSSCSRTAGALASQPVLLYQSALTSV